MKWLMRILFLLVAVFGLVVGALLLMPGDKLATILAEQVKSQTGRELKLTGDVNLSFWPVLGMETGPVTFGNASWAGPEPMLSAESLAVGVDAAALISGDLRIKRVIADNPVLRLELSEGRGNWELSAPVSPTPANQAGGSVQQGQQSKVTLDKLELTNARLVYIENGAKKFDFSNVDLSASWPDVTAPLVVKAQMAVPGGEVDVDLSIKDLPAYSSGVVTPIDLAMTAPGGQFGFVGRVNLAGEMDGKLLAKTTNTERMLAAFGQAGVGVPLGLGQKADISGQMTYTKEGRISLRNMVALLDDNRLTGEADILISDPPHITARLDAGDLDLANFNEAPSASGGEPAPATDQGWSTAPIDASALALANGKIRLKANSIAVPGLTLGASDLTLNLDRSRAVLQMNPATLFSGQLTGQLVANNRNGLSIGGDIQADGVDIQQALSALADIDRLTGTAAGSLKFLGVGQTEDQIMKSLSGSGNLKVGQGVVEGVNLNHLMDRGRGKGGTTVFEEVSASFTMKNGDLTNNDLLAHLEKIRATGQGRVGLGARDIDYVLTPVVLRRSDPEKGISVPVHIVGPWANLTFTPDVTKVIEAAADVKVRELQNKAKKEVLDKVGEELDTTITHENQIEDAVKQKLQDEATKGLLKLFGGN